MKIVVIGGGAVGLGCAYELIQDGHEVTLLEAGQPGAAASHGNAAKIAYAEATPVPAPGMVIQGLKWMLHADSPLYVKPSLAPSFLRFMLAMARRCTEQDFRAGLEANLRLCQRANDLFDEWQSAGLEFEMHQRGVLLAYENEEHFRSRLSYQGIFDSYGVKAEVLDAAGVQQVEPQLSDRIRHGLFYEGDRQIEPDSLISALVGHVDKLGGKVVTDAAVTGFERSGEQISAVRTATDAYACDAVVLAAGVWTGRLAAQLGHRLPLQPGKGYSVDYVPAPFQLRTSLTLEDAHMAVTPLQGMIRLAGTMEFSGFDETINPRRMAAIQRAAKEAFPAWDDQAPHRPAWAGLRPMTPDGLPIVGRLAGNVWAATGHAMLGLTQAPTTGREIRDLIAGRKQPDPRYSVARFGRRPVM